MYILRKYIYTHTHTHAGAHPINCGIVGKEEGDALRLRILGIYCPGPRTTAG